MKNLLWYMLASASPFWTDVACWILRVGIGVLTIGHGLPKIIGGWSEWHTLGVTFMAPLGITFLPVMWGLLGACTEFFGGIALVLGLGIRPASVCLIIMMKIATTWHIQKGDAFQAYSFPLSLIIVYLVIFLLGGEQLSLDYHIARNIDKKHE